MVEDSPTDEQFRRLIEDAPDVVAILEADLTVRFVCRSVRDALGFSPEEVQGSNLKEYAGGEEAKGALRELGMPLATDRGVARTFEVRLRHKDGLWRSFDATVVDRLDDPALRGLALYLRDITEYRAQEKLLAQRALHDPLTGLPNRALYLDRLARALGAAARDGEPIAVLFLDVDDFKSINDSFGHVAGDKLLVALGQRMRACLRPGDTVARLGGDEFAVLIEEAAHDAGKLASRIREALMQPLDLEGRSAQVSASVGVVISTEVRGDERPEDLLRAADEAMYRVKRARARHGLGPGRGSPRGVVRQGLEDRLRRALEQEELGLHYQAAGSPGDRRIACMEALLRWDDVELGNLPPQEIISLAERSDLMAPLGRWILWEACSQALLWRAMWPTSPPLVGVNISVNQFREDSLFESVEATLRETGLDPGALILEVSEDAFDGYAESGVEKLGRLRTLGVKLAVDDFAPSNPESPDLELLPIDFLKFERALVSELGGGRRNAGLLASLYTGIAQARDIGVVAEGVENIEQLEAVEEMSCDLVQGFYLWRPLPGPRATELLATNLGSPWKRGPAG